MNGVFYERSFFAGFSSLVLSDQMTLLQRTWLSILCLNFAFRSATKPGCLVFSQDFKVTCFAVVHKLNFFRHLFLGRRWWAGCAKRW